MTGYVVQDYIRLTEFLGRVLGPDFEVALHDLKDLNHSVIAIANGHISGRTIGSPIGDAARQMLAEHPNSNEPFRFNFSGVSTTSSRTLRSSIFFIRGDDGAIAGLLCINFDDTRYRELSEKILRLRPLGIAGDGSFTYDKDRSVGQPALLSGNESFHSSILSLTESAINQVMGRSGVPVDRLTLSEKMDIISILDEKGIFMLKGAVKLVAQRLSCSQASVYRYLNRVNGGKKEESSDATA